MLRNISYNDLKIKEEIKNTISEQFTLFERIKMKEI